MNMRLATTWSVVGIVLTAAFVGCGSAKIPTYPAGGKVSYLDGTPLAGGWVEFRPVASEHKVSARGQIQQNGSFELGTFEPGDGAIEGEHLALVIPPPPKGDRDEMPHYRPPVDPRFGRFNTSGLRFTVTRDSAKNRFHIQITAEHKRRVDGSSSSH